MIARLDGTLSEVREDHLLLRAGAITYAVHFPAGDRGAWLEAIGESITLTTLQYFEVQGQGSSMTPRLIGFRRELDRDFFELFTTVKGIGARKALRILQLPCPEVAAAIAAKDAALLTTLPEVGKRTAETIVAELHGKVDPFLDSAGPVASAVESKPRLTPIAQDAIAVLVQLGESAPSAEQRVCEALRQDPALSTADAIVARIYNS